MKKFVRVLVRVLLVAVALVLVVVGIRVVNGFRYPTPASLSGNQMDASRYPLTQPDVTIERVQGTYLNGFHVKAKTLRRGGLIVVWGGSDGGPDYERAVRIAQQGYDVLSLFFFGQPNQKPTLAEVPLDFFDEVLTWRDANVNPGPITVIGTSKGAELALVLQARYPRIDNVVVYTPTLYSWQGLDYTTAKASWTWHGEPLPAVNFRYADASASAGMVASMLFNTPMRLRATYESAAAHDPNASAALIEVKVPGHLLALAGDDDAMWPGDQAARTLGALKPGATEAHVFPGAGHLFGANDGYALGYLLGGTRAANEAAQEQSDRILDAALDAWYPLR